MSTSAPPTSAPAGSRPTGRPAWLALGAAALVVPTVLAGLSLLWPRPQIEADLTGAATRALTAAGLDAGGVTFSGRDATITGLAGPDGQRAVEIVEGVTGVRVAQLAGGNGNTGNENTGSGNTGGGAGPAAVAGAFGAGLRGDDLVLGGVVGSEEERAALVAAATERAGGRTVVDELTVTPGATPPGGLDAAALGAAAGVLADTGGDGLALAVETGADGSPVLSLTGEVADDAASAAAQQALEDAVPGATVDNRLTVAAPTAPTTPAPAGDLDEAGRAALQAEIDALVAAAPITFGPDSPELTPAGSGTVDRIVELVVAAPGARLQVDGFVATGPGSGRFSAQELSDRRAAAVRDALVAGGVPADRVTAAGRGEGDRPAARDAGRRAAVTVV